MTLARAGELIDEAVDHAVGSRGSVAVRARLALAHTTLQDECLDDTAEHLRIAFELTHRESVSIRVGNARQIVESATSAGDSA